MAGVSTESGKGSRKELNMEVNMVPMIDLLMVTISFLLITAVWSHMSRLEADAKVPSPSAVEPCGAVANPCEPELKRLHVDMRGSDKFVLSWRRGGALVSSVEIPRHDAITNQGALKVVRFPELAAKVEAEWKAEGSHHDATDRRRDEAVLHTDDVASYATIVAAIDAIYQVRRPVSEAGRTTHASAFNVTFSAAN